MADLDIGMKCIKYLLFLISAMFVLTATLVLIIGTSIHSIYETFSYFITDGFMSPTALLISIGIIMLIIALFGCIGAVKESTCMVNTFALMLTLVFIMEVAASIAAFSLQDGLREMVTNSLNHSMNTYHTSEKSRYEMDTLQQDLRCCGIRSGKEWEPIFSGMSQYYPESCCNNYIQNTERCEIYENGCLPELVNIISQSAVLLGTGAITIAFIQFIGIIFSIMLASGIRHAKTERQRRLWEIREQMINGGTGYSQMEQHKGSASTPASPVVYVPTVGHTQA